MEGTGRGGRDGGAKRGHADDSASESDDEEGSRVHAARPAAKRRHALIGKRGADTRGKKVARDERGDKTRDAPADRDADDSEADGSERATDGVVIDGLAGDDGGECGRLLGPGVIGGLDGRNKVSFVEVGNAGGGKDCEVIEKAQSLWCRKNWQGELVSKVRKRKKIRSRQKNLKRDKRCRDQLPAHLNEETLVRGRVKRMEQENLEQEISAWSYDVKLWRYVSRQLEN